MFQPLKIIEKVEGVVVQIIAQISVGESEEKYIITEAIMMTDTSLVSLKVFGNDNKFLKAGNKIRIHNGVMELVLGEMRLVVRKPFSYIEIIENDAKLEKPKFKHRHLRKQSLEKDKEILSHITYEYNMN